MSDKDVVEAAMEWHMARTSFLKLPAGAPEARECLGRLASAEDALSKAVKDGVSNAFGKKEVTIRD